MHLHPGAQDYPAPAHTEHLGHSWDAVGFPPQVAGSGSRFWFSMILGTETRERWDSLSALFLLYSETRS